MELDQLQKLVSHGEGKSLEFKNRVPNPERLAREIVSFSNSSGGIILIGVEDNGHILGVKDHIEERFAIEKCLRENCSDGIDLEVQNLAISKKRTVIILHVRESKMKPVYVLHTTETGESRQIATVRVADKAVDASRELRRILRYRTSERNVKVEIGEKEERLMKFLSENGKVSLEEYSNLVEVSNRSASQTLVLLTNAGLLDIIPGEQEDLYILPD